jgi:hypothetical protein
MLTVIFHDGRQNVTSALAITVADKQFSKIYGGSELEQCSTLTTRQCQRALERGLAIASIASDEQQPAIKPLEFGASKEIASAIGDAQSVPEQFAGPFVSTKRERSFGNRR